MNNRQVIDQQLVYIARLQALQPNKPVLVQRPLNGNLELVGKKWLDWHSVFTTEPLLTCSVLSNEIAIDPDLKDWGLLRIEINKLLEYLNRVKIPHLLSWTGGNGVHVEIFFKSDIQIPHDIGNKIKEYGVDVGIIVRTFLTNWLLNHAEVKPETIALDWGKIKWSGQRKGSMIRIFGAKRPDGGVKTLIQEVPETRPKPGMLPLTFPQDIETWDITFLHNEILAAILKEIESKTPEEEDPEISWLTNAIYKAKKEGRITYSGKKNLCIGCQRAMQGAISEGNRDNVASGLIHALRFWKGYTRDATSRAMKQWSKTCKPAFDIKVIEYKINLVYSKPKLDYTPCTFFIRSGLCTGATCKIIKARGA